MFVVFVEAVGVFWFYGVDNFSADIEQMLGEKPSLYWRVCWRFFTPVFLLVICKTVELSLIFKLLFFSIFQVILIFSVLNNEDMLGEEYYYPSWAVPLGWVLTASSVMCIPLYMIYKFDKSRGSFKRVKFSLNFKKKNSAD